MPIRQVQTDDKLRIWRDFKIGPSAHECIADCSGKLADMVMLDTRQYDRSITDVCVSTSGSTDAAATTTPTRSAPSPMLRTAR